MPGQYESPETHSPDGFLSSYTPITRLWNGLLDLVFPPQCTGCNRVDTRWCAHCQAELEAVPIVLQKRKIGDIPVIATGIHEGKLQEAVQALKYNQVPSLYVPLGERLVTLLKDAKTPFDTVIPVPLHASRQKQRGFNQSQLLSFYISHKLNLTYLAKAIVRTRNTPPQVGLSREERLNNMKGAFTANPDLLQGRSILIIDDVCTTGATIAACAIAVKQAGAKRVYALTVTMAKS